MRRFIYLFLLVVIASCAQPTAKERQKNRPVFSNSISEPNLKIIVDEYFNLSSRNNIHFTKNVSIGFSKIDKKSVIGQCAFGRNWREVELDTEYWKRSTWISKIALVYHELTHCYCGRGHDFGNGEEYPDQSIKSIIDRILIRQPFSPLKPTGYLDDSCPKSIMHPIILDDYCFEKHYEYYVKEMFDRCEPY